MRYKICDPIHGFIRFNALEKQVIDSRAYQRLRYIIQMGVAYLVYPGATHTRFDHSLGVMELVTRMYRTFSDETTQDQAYWQQILRLAALCHDMGHLPFSHTAEKPLLPGGGHERMTVAVIASDEMRSIWKGINAPAGRNAVDDIIKLAVGEGETPWEKLLASAITEDNFGADRIDYLIRDAVYTGVGYGHFDYNQLIDSVRILPPMRMGVTQSGLQSVESLWMARYLMYSRVYHHPKCRILSSHMRRFMFNHYARVGFPSTVDAYLDTADYRILSAISEAAREGDEDALCLLKQRPCYSEVKVPEGDVVPHLDDLKQVFDGALFVDYVPPKTGDRGDLRRFAVESDDGCVISSGEASEFLREIPLGTKSLGLYAHPEIAEEVTRWLAQRAAPVSSV